MKKTKFFLYAIVFISILAYSTIVEAKEDRRIFLRVKRSIRHGNVDFAFMGCQDIINNYPKSKYREECLFVNGEYLYLLPNYEESKKVFLDFIETFPDSRARIFALAFLYKISLMEEDQQSVEKYKNEIINNQQLSLIFRKKEEYTYKSIYNRIYTVNKYIDKVEFYVEGEPLTKLSY